MARPVPWVPPLLYGAVLAGGVYYAAIGPGSGLGLRAAGFVVVLGALIAMDARDLPFSSGVLFAVRVALLCAVTALDTSGLSRVLFVLVPFLGFFVFGRTVAVALGAGCVAAMALAFTIWVPGWQVRAAYISDLLMFALGVVLSITMAAVAVRERAARARLEETLAQVAELSAARERNRLAREIHDSLGHHLTAIGIQLEKAQAFAELDAAGAAQAVSGARWSADRALEEVRASVRTIGSETPTMDLSTALADLVRHLDGDAQRITLSVEGAERRPLFVLYRAAQEALTNACRHSGASRIRLSVSYDEQGALLRVEDDGRGLHGAPEGFGLAGLRERVGLAGGTVDVRGSTGGTALRVWVPW